MHELWKTANMMYTRSLNYSKSMLVGKHGTQTFEVLLVALLLLLLLFDVSVPQVHNPYYFWTSGLSKYTYMLVLPPLIRFQSLNSY